MVASKYKKYINKYNTTKKKEKKKKNNILQSYTNVWLSADTNKYRVTVSPMKVI